MLTVALNVASRAYTGGVSLLLAPIFIRLLGYSGYGLVGVMTLVTSAAFLLDMGASASITRELAKSPKEAPRILRSFEVAYWTLSISCGCLVYLAAPLLQRHWLNDGSVPPDQVVRALRLMAIVLGLSMPVSLYSAALIGLHRIHTLSAMSAVNATIKNVGALVALLTIASNSDVFFLWQAVAAGTAGLIARQTAWALIQKTSETPVFDPWLLRGAARFAIGMGAVSAVSIGIQNLDRVVLAKVLPLASFGLYSLASSLAGVLLLLSAAVYNVYVAKITAAIASSQRVLTQRLFEHATDTIAVLVCPAAAVMVVLADRCMQVAVGEPETGGGPVFALLSIGMLLNAFSWPPYSLLIGAGKAKAIFKLSLVSALIGAPLVVAGGVRYGAIGSASALLVYQAVMLIGMVRGAVMAGLLTNLRAWLVQVGLANASAFLPVLVFGSLTTHFGFYTRFTSTLTVAACYGVALAFTGTYFLLWRGNDIRPVRA